MRCQYVDERLCVFSVNAIEIYFFVYIFVHQKKSSMNLMIYYRAYDMTNALRVISVTVTI